MARPRKVKLEKLYEIIKEYLTENQYITTLKYSDLAKYSKELGYKDITYQDFCRNTHIKAYIDEYNKQKKMTMYSKLNSDKLEKLNFNVDGVVDKNIKDKNQLKVILKIFKNGYDRAFDTLVDNDKIIEEYINKIREQEKAIKELKEKNSLLRKKVNENEELYHANRNKEKGKWIYLAIKYLMEENNMTIKSEEYIIEILKNFGYHKEEDIINEKDIINSEFKNNDGNTKSDNEIGLNDLNKEKIIPIKKKHELKIPDFMK
ncbi:hypothetical protein [Clostridium sp.]|uniref:hypothetical protein n=1 Tax=Clostridium sp. TaxID=1506 RepID=UPI002625ABE1|nr:hypothetical protein [uncultured Clostridium sp.]